MDYIIVQAGGKGTRLKHLTKNKPKALVPIDNLPMLFHLFRKYPDKRFIIIADYHREVLREYLSVFADVKYQIVDASGTGTCSGVKQAVDLIPEDKTFMLIWSDLVLPDGFELPEGYAGGEEVELKNYVGLSKTFPCRWKFENGIFEEESSTEFGVAGFFLFKNKTFLKNIPESGELVRWLKDKSEWSVFDSADGETPEPPNFDVVSLAGTREFGLLEEYEKLETAKCRPFNKITIEGKTLIKEPVDAQGEGLAKRECAWYDKARKLNISVLPEIYETAPLKMEFIDGKNIYECDFSFDEKKRILTDLVGALKKLHQSESVPADTFSIQQAYYEKTIDRLSTIEDLVPFAREKEIRVNGKKCRNIFFCKRELEKKIDELKNNCDRFAFIHGDCTFSNMMVRNSGEPVLIDPRGYFGYTELFGDERYDWAKVYYSVVGNYDRFNLKRFRLEIGANADEGVKLDIESNHWEDMEEEFFKLTGTDSYEIKLLHAVIWLSLTTYAWQDYDSICGAFYNGLWYLEDVL